MDKELYLQIFPYSLLTSEELCELAIKLIDHVPQTVFNNSNISAIKSDLQRYHKSYQRLHRAVINNAFRSDIEFWDNLREFHILALTEQFHDMYLYYENTRIPEALDIILDCLLDLGDDIGIYYGILQREEITEAINQMQSPSTKHACWLLEDEINIVPLFRAQHHFESLFLELVEPVNSKYCYHDLWKMRKQFSWCLRNFLMFLSGELAKDLKKNKLYIDRISLELAKAKERIARRVVGEINDKIAVEVGIFHF